MIAGSAGRTNSHLLDLPRAHSRLDGCRTHVSESPRVSILMTFQNRFCNRAECIRPSTSPSARSYNSMAWDDPKHEPPDRDPSIIDPGYGKPYPHHPAPAPSTPPPSDGGRQRAVRNPSAPSTPDPTPDPTPNVPPPTGSILPVPIYQQGPQRTDVFVPENKVPLPVIYGQQRVGAQVWYRKVQADNTEVVLYAICHGPINSISNILIEGKPITQFATIETYTGTSGQALSAIGSTAEPTLWTSAFPYVAYVVAKFSNPSVTHTTPDVMRFTCDVQGMLVRDPRTDATLVNRYYRDNPALCLADLLSSPMHADANGNKYSYGAEVADAQLDWYGTITTAANDCNVLLADGVSKRFTMGLAMLDKKSIGDWIEAIRQHGQLMRPIYNNGLYQIVMDKAQSSSGITLTSQGSSANIISCSPLVMKSSSQIPTRVIINFVNAAANYKNDSVQDDDPGIAGGTVEIVERTYEFGQIPYDQAKRLAKYLRKRASQQFSGVIRVNAEGLQLLPGIRVPVTSDQWNLGAADMIVSDLSSVAGGNDYASAWDASVEFYESGIYDDTQSTATPHAPPLSPSPYDPPADPTGITISPASPQYLGPVDHATLTYTTPATPFFETVEIYIEYSSDGGGSYGTKTHLSDAPTSPFTLPLFPSSSGVANSPGLYRLTFVTRTFAQQRSAGAIQTYQVTAAGFGAGMVLSGM